MWFEILPSLGIIGVCLAIPHVTNVALNYLFRGNPYRRTLVQDYDRYLWFRDEKITGDPYKPQGLDGIKD